MGNVNFHIQLQNYYFLLQISFTFHDKIFYQSYQNYYEESYFPLPVLFSTLSFIIFPKLTPWGTRGGDSKGEINQDPVIVNSKGTQRVWMLSVHTWKGLTPVGVRGSLDQRLLQLIGSRRGKKAAWPWVQGLWPLTPLFLLPSVLLISKGDRSSCLRRELLFLTLPEPLMSLSPPSLLFRITWRLQVPSVEMCVCGKGHIV